LNKFVLDWGARLERVELWTTDAVSDLDIYVYDDFSGGSLSNLLTSITDLSYSEMGYISVPLPDTIGLESGDDIYVVVKVTNVGFTSPLTYDSKDYSDWAGMSYISPDGSSWTLFDGGDIGIRVRVRKQDATSPSPLQSFEATPGDGSVTLRWTNPADTDFAYALIEYSTQGYVSDPGEGTPVENGNDGKFGGAPTAVDSFIHEDLTNGVTYYYTAFAVDSALNYSSPVFAMATPVDTVPPAPIAGFEALGLDEAVLLRWINPSDNDLDRVHIVYSTSPAPWDPDSVTSVENGSDGYFDAEPALSDSFLHENVDNGTTYYYCIRTLDEMENISLCTYASATPQDTFPPSITISVLQNPYITNHLDIYVAISEATIETSLVVQVGGSSFSPQVVDADGNLYRIDYDIYSAGRLDLRACARDLAFNWASAQRSFGVSKITTSGGVAYSFDGNLELSLPPGALENQAFILIGACDSPGSMTTYEILPQGLEFHQDARIGIRYDHVPDPHDLVVARLSDGDVRLLESSVDEDRHMIYAYAHQSGTYGLVAGQGVRSRSYDDRIMHLWSEPNPFSETTEIVFDITSATELDVTITTIDGRYVTRLYCGQALPGRYRLRWDGTNSAGKRVASGVYMCRIASGRGTHEYKVLLLR